MSETHITQLNDAYEFYGFAWEEKGPQSLVILDAVYTCLLYTSHLHILQFMVKKCISEVSVLVHFAIHYAKLYYYSVCCTYWMKRYFG